jgi:uncharacterized membrane protein
MSGERMTGFGIRDKVRGVPVNSRANPKVLLNTCDGRPRQVNQRRLPSRAPDGEGLEEDAAHESHRDFRSGPAQEELRQRVRTDRRRLPRVLRGSLWLSLGILVLSGLLIALLAVVDPQVLTVLGQMIALSFAVGREAAMLWAYSQTPAPSPAWVFLATALDDLLTMGLTLPLLWIALERLRGVFFIGGVVLSVEKTAVEKRAFLRRWGVWGLVAFIWFPGVGAGIFLAAAIGMIAKIPLKRLIVALSGASILVNAFWSIGLYYTSGLIPREGAWSYGPIVFAGALGVLAIVFGVRQHHLRHLFPIVKVQMLGPQHVSRLLEVGITDGIDLLYANRTILAKKLGMDPALLGRLRSVAELSLLRAVSPRHAEMLAVVGISDIRELSVAPPELVAAALKELELKHVIQPRPGEEEIFPEKCARWTNEAKAFLAEANE